jgi:hypothetical protein
VDGVHLRWAFKRDLGFPWYGFYIFRRPHQVDAPICLSPMLLNLPVGPTGSSQMVTSIGVISSDQNLVLTENFPPTGSRELDLAGRKRLRFALPPGQVANLAQIHVGFRQPSAGGDPNVQFSLGVTAFLDDQPVGQAVVTGQAGQLAAASIAFDAISAIEVASGPASLIDICYIPVSQSATIGWQAIPEFSYPLCLPMTHPDYPCSGNLPVNPGAAEARALGRVVYGSPAAWGGAPFADLHEQLTKLVEGGPGSVPMASRTIPAITATPVPPDPGLEPPQIPALAPLDLVLLSSLHPAMAQMIGLYWVDRKAPPDVVFDYLIVADYTGQGGREAGRLLSVIQQNGFAALDGYIAFNLRSEKAVPLSPPDQPLVYALPGGTRQVQGGGLEDVSNNAGLRWNLGVNLGILEPGHSLMYHVWRADLGDGELPAAPPSYVPLTKEGPVLVVEPNIPPGILPERAGDWPLFPLHYIDTRLNDGWYGYQVSGVDIFGRHSPNSAAAAWYQWAPVPDPRPWYYRNPPGDTAIHPSAVRLLDKLPPPPPTGVEAYALDPVDPTVIKDAAYDVWWASLNPTEQSSVIGLRVRWLWTDAHRREAPDTREFRVYYQSGQPNTLPGRLGNVTRASDTESDVETDIASSYPVDSWTGAWLRVAGHSFPVIGNQAGSPLRLRVGNLGLTYTTGTVDVTNGSATVTGTGGWHAGMVGKSFQVADDAAIHTILSVQSPTQLTLSRIYAGTTASGENYTIFYLRPGAGAWCTLVVPSTYGAGTVDLTLRFVHCQWDRQRMECELRRAGLPRRGRPDPIHHPGGQCAGAAHARPQLLRPIQRGQALHSLPPALHRLHLPGELGRAVLRRRLRGICHRHYRRRGSSAASLRGAAPGARG